MSLGFSAVARKQGMSDIRKCQACRHPLAVLELYYNFIRFLPWLSCRGTTGRPGPGQIGVTFRPLGLAENQEAVTVKFKTAFFAAVLLALAIPLISCLGTSNLAVSSCDRAYLYGRSPVLLVGTTLLLMPFPCRCSPGLSPAAPAPDSDLTPIYHEAAPHVRPIVKPGKNCSIPVLPSLSCPEHGYCLPEMPALAELLKPA